MDGMVARPPLKMPSSFMASTSADNSLQFKNALNMEEDIVSKPRSLHRQVAPPECPTKYPFIMLSETKLQGKITGGGANEIVCS